MLVKVDGTNYVRDTGSRFLNNLDTSAKNEYYSKLKLLKTQKNEINRINTEIAEIKTDVSDIKTMLQQIVSSLK